MEFHKKLQIQNLPYKDPTVLLYKFFLFPIQAWNHSLALKKLDLSQNVIVPAERHYTKDSILEIQ